MNKIWITGDLHGRFQSIRNFCESGRIDPTETNYLIILGDFGGNYFFNYRDNNFKEKLSKYSEKYNLTYFVIRGNHEERPSNCAEKNPDDWHLDIFWNGLVWIENKYPFIKYAFDEPSLYDIEGKKALVFPGAYSPDKNYRLANGYSWFSEEQMTDDEMGIGLQLLKENPKCDYIFSHTCPLMFEPYICNLFLPQISQKTIDKSTERYLNNIIDMCEYKRYYFGHFHDNRNIPPYQATMLFHDVVELGDKICM